MNTEHDEVIEAMAKALAGIGPNDRWPNHAGAPIDPYPERARDALRAAAERGWVLAKLPKYDPYPVDDWDAGWNACVYATIIVELD